MNTSRRFFLQAWLAASALLLGCATPGVAPEIVKTLAPTGTLRVGVYAGSPTSLVRGPGVGEMRGVTVDIGRALAQRLGVPVDFVVLERVPEIIDALKAGRVDFTITNASPARARDVDFTPPLIGIESGYLVAAASPLRVLADIDRAGVRVGVTQGSTSQSVLSRDLTQARMVVAPSVSAATQMLRLGELDAFATNKAILFEMADQLPGARVLGGRWGMEQLAIAVPQGRTAAAPWLQAFAADVTAKGLVQQAAQRAGLRGTVAPTAP
jgi:polar amino acid transport system substrate-binding protein